eukprot:9500954-Pyramimonas_sp.AAC.1
MAGREEVRIKKVRTGSLELCPPSKDKQELEATDGRTAGRASRAPVTPTKGREEARTRAKNAAPTSDHRKDDES